MRLLKYIWYIAVLAGVSGRGPAIAQSKHSEVIAVLDSGDFVQPHFSPDGTFLAFAAVFRRGNSETTEIRLYDIRNRQTKTLLDTTSTNQYAGYIAFVLGIKWISRNEIAVSISDGDVGITTVLLDASQNRIIDSQYSQEDDGIKYVVPAELTKLARRIQAAFPDVDDTLLNSMFSQGTNIPITERGMLVQKNYHGHDANIWFYDLQTKTQHKLIELSHKNLLALGGGAVIGSNILFLLSTEADSTASVFEYAYKDQILTELVSFPRKKWRASFDLKYKSDDQIIFRVQAYPPYEKGNNPLFSYSSGTLTDFIDFEELYDADIDSLGSQIAFCVWKGNERNIIIKYRQ